MGSADCNKQTDGLVQSCKLGLHSDLAAFTKKHSKKPCLFKIAYHARKQGQTACVKKHFPESVKTVILHYDTHYFQFTPAYSYTKNSVMYVSGLKNYNVVKTWENPTGWKLKASHFIIKPVMNGDYYQLRARHNPKVSVYSAGSSKNYGPVQVWNNLDKESDRDKGNYKFYPRGDRFMMSPKWAPKATVYACCSKPRGQELKMWNNIGESSDKALFKPHLATKR